MTNHEKDELLAALAELDASCLCDIKKDARVMSNTMRPINPGLRLIGRARTVAVRDDFLTVIQALKEAREGEVLAIDGSGGKKALLGELFANEAKRKGLGGIVVDGACRDTAGIRLSGLPVFSSAVTPMAGTCKILFETQTAISCAGVRVNPGDIVFGDDDGVVVFSDEELKAILSDASQVQRRESQIVSRIRNGDSLMDMIDIDRHLAAVANGEESKLQFV